MHVSDPLAISMSIPWSENGGLSSSRIASFFSSSSGESGVSVPFLFFFLSAFACFAACFFFFSPAQSLPPRADPPPMRPEMGPEVSQMKSPCARMADGSEGSIWRSSGSSSASMAVVIRLMPTYASEQTVKAIGSMTSGCRMTLNSWRVEKMMAGLSSFPASEYVMNESTAARIGTNDLQGMRRHERQHEPGADKRKSRLNLHGRTHACSREGDRLELVELL